MPDFILYRIGVSATSYLLIMVQGVTSEYLQCWQGIIIMAHITYYGAWVCDAETMQTIYTTSMWVHWSCFKILLVKPTRLANVNEIRLIDILEDNVTFRH